MQNTTRSAIEQLAHDLRQSFVQVVYWAEGSRRELAVFRDFVGNYEFLGLEGLSCPKLVIRQWKGSDKPDLEIPLSDVREIEIQRADPRGGDFPEVPLAYWNTPFGCELERHAVPEA